MNFGQAVHSKRTKLGLSLRDLGKSAGLNPSYISKIEKGEIPSPGVAMRLAKALGENEEEYKKFVIETKAEKQIELDNKRSLVYGSPLSAEAIKKILDREMAKRKKEGKKAK